jgi:hypothetical protein
MAGVDTANKRFAIMALDDMDSFAPTPDGSIANAADREQLVGIYPGFALAGGQPPPTVDTTKQRNKRRDRR